MTTKQNKKIKSLPLIVAIVLVAIGIIIYYFQVMKPNNQSNSTETEYVFTKEGELYFSDISGNQKVKLNIEFAENEYDRELGLMYRKQMDEDQGMLFIFPNEEQRSFWMHNTYIPLDIIFINTDKKIVKIHKNCKTLSDDAIGADSSKYVLETIGGYTDKYKIVEGDKIDFIKTK